LAGTLYSSPRRRSQAIGYAFVFLALLVSAIALFLGCIGAYAIYVALTYQPGDSIGHVGAVETFLFPITGPIIGLRIVLFALEAVAIRVSAILYPALALIAATVAWLLWNAAKRRLKSLA
jgi:hypothetical protein